MERFVINQLLKWKESKYRKPLILKGVRQVGKTWLLKEFGRRYYENIAYFNLMNIWNINSFLKQQRILKEFYKTYC